jgi:hypothetical protein
MEKPTHEDSPDLFNKELKTIHWQVCLEAVNAIDELSEYFNDLGDGRMLYDAKWHDAEDMRCVLKMYTKPDPSVAIDVPPVDRLKVEFVLNRETSMPGQSHERYYFNTTKLVGMTVDDDSNKTIANQSNFDDLKYLKIVHKSLIERPSRKQPSESLLRIALEYAIEDPAIRTKIIRISEDGKHAKDRMTIERVINSVLKFEPILSELVVRNRIYLESTFVMGESESTRAD